MKRLAAIALTLLTACTPGGSFSGGGSSGGGNVTTIDINLTLHQNGFSPDLVNVAVGSSIRFDNSDGFAHTATLIPGATTFPSGRPWDASVTSQIPKNGPALLSQPWSSGALQAGSSSQIISVDAPGTYLFGCYFHYGAPMRGTIVAQ